MNFDKSVNHLVNKDHDRYLGHIVRGMQATFKYNSEGQLKPYDNDVLSQQFYLAVQRVVESHSNEKKLFTVADCFNASL